MFFNVIDPEGIFEWKVKLLPIHRKPNKQSIYKAFLYF